MSDTVPMDILSTAILTYQLEVTLGNMLNADALQKAIESALLAYESQVVRRIIAIMEAAEGELNNDDEDAAAVGIAYAVNRIRELVPVASDHITYQPAQDDIIEIVLCGRVHVSDDKCDQCGKQSGQLWSLYDFRTGAEYYFDQSEIRDNLTARMVKRAGEEGNA
jgi:hypothetical protein